MYRLCPSAYMVSKAREDFPDPESPVRTTSSLRGISTEIFLRLCSFAPRILIYCFAMYRAPVFIEFLCCQYSIVRPTFQTFVRFCFSIFSSGSDGGQTVPIFKVPPPVRSSCPPTQRMTKKGIYGKIAGVHRFAKPAGSSGEGRPQQPRRQRWMRCGI